MVLTSISPGVFLFCRKDGLSGLYWPMVEVFPSSMLACAVQEGIRAHANIAGVVKSDVSWLARGVCLWVSTGRAVLSACP